MVKAFNNAPAANFIKHSDVEVSPGRSGQIAVTTERGKRGICVKTRSWQIYPDIQS